MEMNINITIVRIEAKISIPEAKRQDNILAFGFVYFFEANKTEPIIKQKGFTIRLKTFGEKKVIAVVFPGYQGKIRFFTSFILPDKNLYLQVSKLLLDEYHMQGGDPSFNTTSEDDVDIDDIPDDLGQKP